MEYRLNENTIESIDENHPLRDGDILLEILTTEEYHAKEDTIPHHRVISQNLDPVKFCKAELLEKGVVGTLLVPVKDDILHHEISLTYYLEDKHFIFIDAGHDLEHAMDAVHETPLELNSSVGFFFYELLQSLITNDVVWLQQYEKKLIAIEEDILNSDNLPMDINRKILCIRKEVLIMSTYYQQMSDMTDALVSNDNLIFSAADCRRFEILSARLERLHSHSVMLREYSIQLRELQQTQIEMRQNKNMSLLTVATTIFFPLSLIVGWYGMNFADMPEYNIDYAYPILIIVSLFIIIIEIIYFKKKHFFD
ncbi:MAG: CorA family divalent cation transporter [Lachnospiraceae bacterium]|nr:CorA family divalent cation transporter [Lachnospiraceae bacterium]